MERVFFTQHKGKKILVIDASNCKHDESLAIITKAKKIIRSQLPNSVYTSRIQQIPRITHKLRKP